MDILSKELSSNYLGHQYGLDSVDARRPGTVKGLDPDIGYRDTVEHSCHHWEDTEPDKDACTEFKPYKSSKSECQHGTTVSECSEEGFKRGHARKDSGHVVVTGAESNDGDTLSPIVSSDEEGDGITGVEKTIKSRKDDMENEHEPVEEKSDTEVFEKETVRGSYRISGKRKKTNIRVKNSGKAHDVQGTETKQIYPVSYDISKLGCSTVTNEEDSDAVVKDTHPNRNNEAKPVNKPNTVNSKTFERTVELIENGYDTKSKEQHVHHDTRSTPSAKTETCADFGEAIQESFADLVHADMDAMELCDYLYQYRIMTRKTYEHFFELSHSASSNSKINIQRRLMLFLSKQLPRDTLERAVSQAGYLHVFFDVFMKLDNNGSLKEN